MIAILEAFMFLAVALVLGVLLGVIFEKLVEGE